MEWNIWFLGHMITILPPHLKLRKAPGADNITNEYILQCGNLNLLVSASVQDHGCLFKNLGGGGNLIANDIVFGSDLNFFKHTKARFSKRVIMSNCLISSP